MIEYIDLPKFHKEVLILGTNHSLNYSSLQTMQYIKLFKPDTCVLELCHTRLNEIYTFYEQLQEKTV